MLTTSDKVTICKCLKAITALRKQRRAEIGAEFFVYDKRCETIEGTAAYVEIRMRAILEGIAPFEAAADYLSVLAANGNLLGNYRYRCYVAGLALCLALDIMWPQWQTEWAKSEKTIFDWIKEKITSSEAEVIVSPADLGTAGELLAIYQSEKESKIDAFAAQPLTLIEGAVQLTGFDPMNLTCVNGRCLHLHGRLRFGESEQLIAAPFLEEYGDTILDVKCIRIPNLNIDFSGPRIIIEGFGEINGHAEQTADGAWRIIAQ